MNNFVETYRYYLLVLLVVFVCFFVTTNGESVASDIVANSEGTKIEVLDIVVNESKSRSMKDNSYPVDGNRESRRSDQKNKESIRKEKDMYDIMRLHQINNNLDKQLKADHETKEKGKLQTVGGMVGEIIAVIVSEVVKLFGNIVSDVAREVTAHGFVSVFKQFTDLTGISLPEI